jgi:hypothetical protein
MVLATPMWGLAELSSRVEQYREDNCAYTYTYGCIIF